MNGKRAPFACRVNNATDNFYEYPAYIKTPLPRPIYAVCSSTESAVVMAGGETVCILAREMQVRRIGAKLMQRVVLVLFTVFAATISLNAGPVQKKDQPSKQEKTNHAASMTGCVDEQEGKYVLVDDHTLARIADLEADGFPNEGFAKHMGHKVTVRGINITNGARPLFKVRTVETVSETCAPQPVPEKK